MQEPRSLAPPLSLSRSLSAPCSAVKIDQQTRAFSFSLSLGSHQLQRLSTPALRTHTHFRELVHRLMCGSICARQPGLDCLITFNECVSCDWWEDDLIAWGLFGLLGSFSLNGDGKRLTGLTLYLHTMNWNPQPCLKTPIFTRVVVKKTTNF